MNNKYHFIAIGGVGMSAIAKYLLENGCEVSGSDINENKQTKYSIYNGFVTFLNN